LLAVAAEPSYGNVDTMADQDMLGDDEIVQEDTWEVIRKYFDENGLVQQQRSSYNEFILQNIQEVSSLPVTGISLLL
jgi:DNA-directed RNA polymerase beta subunit